MTSFAEDRDRSVIPRWRSVRSARALLETADARELEATPVGSSDIESRLAEWRQHGHPIYAADAFGVALATGQPLQAIDAATALLGGADPRFAVVREIARRVVSPATENLEEEHIESGRPGQHERIHILRVRLADEPRNAFLWIDLALSYAILGLAEKALAAAQNALSMAPNDRLVLRSVARLLVHQDRPDKAHALLARNSATRQDPWLLAAELATARAADQAPQLVRAARALAVDDQYLPLHRSELLAALATLEHDTGSQRRARKLFSQSLMEPTENAVAQATWASRRDSQIALTAAVLDVPRSFEARAWSAFRQGDWSTAAVQAKRWHADQPFSARPALLATYVSSSMLEDYAEAERIAREALDANSTDFGLRNNLTFALAMQDRVEEAYREFSKSPPTTPRDALIHAATGGLISFRTGDLASGRSGYRVAIREGRKLPDGIRFAAMALIRLAFEEMRTRTEEAETAVAEALAERAKLGAFDDDVRELLARLERSLREEKVGGVNDGMARPGGPSTARSEKM